MPNLPNLFVVGAVKAGTTSLHSYLGSHPEIAMSAIKELKLFSRPDWADRLDWYMSQFRAAPVRGESSPAYTIHPVFPGVPERIHSVVPHARFIYLVRDPIERAIAHWVEYYSLYLEHRPLNEALRDELAANQYVAASMYATQVERYLDWFPRSHFLVIDQHDLLLERRATMRRVFSFLGVEPGFSSPSFERVLNPREQKLRLNRAGAWLWNRGILKPLLKEATRLPASLRWVVRPVAARIEPAPLDPELRTRLAKLLEGEAARLRDLTGERFATWSL